MDRDHSVAIMGAGGGGRGYMGDECDGEKRKRNTK